MAVTRRKKHKDQVAVSVTNHTTGLVKTVETTKRGEHLRLDTIDPEGLKIVEEIRATTSYKGLRLWKGEHQPELDALSSATRQAVEHQFQARMHEFFYPEG